MFDGLLSAGHCWLLFYTRRRWVPSILSFWGFSCSPSLPQLTTLTWISVRVYGIPPPCSVPLWLRRLLSHRKQTAEPGCRILSKRTWLMVFVGWNCREEKGNENGTPKLSWVGNHAAGQWLQTARGCGQGSKGSSVIRAQEIDKQKALVKLNKESSGFTLMSQLFKSIFCLFIGFIFYFSDIKKKKTLLFNGHQCLKWLNQGDRNQIWIVACTYFKPLDIC